MRIALVDDNRDDLQTLHRCLTENLISDCDIVEFTDGDEFLKNFLTDPPQPAQTGGQPLQR